jgi:catechol 2,3-dioxygenase-like lactoylglutathione lyase family enzyme
VTTVSKFYARTVFFVSDASRSLAFYTKELGFSLDWMYEEKGRPHVFQVSLHGLELILNQTEPATGRPPGHGRVFIGLEPEESATFKQHVESRGIKTTTVYWGAPTIAIYDPDDNELFFWLPEAERQKLEVGGAGVA